jgi:uncharacterized protein YcnI
MNKRPLFRASAALAVAAALALAAPLAASAHVRVVPDQATPGDYSVLTFRVPTESATAGTVKLEVDLPTTTPFTSVSLEPITGWSGTVTTSKLDKPVKVHGTTVTEAPTKVVWTADAGVQVAPGQFQRFVISAGPVPDTGSVMLPAHQTYSDGSVVDWDQPTPASGEEPEHPAPTLYINDAPPSAEGAATVTPSPEPATSTSASDDGTGTVGIVLGIAGLALGAIALVVAVFAVTRRTPATTATAAPANSDRKGD